MYVYAYQLWVRIVYYMAISKYMLSKKHSRTCAAPAIINNYAHAQFLFCLHFKVAAAAANVRASSKTNTLLVASDARRKISHAYLNAARARR